MDIRAILSVFLSVCVLKADSHGGVQHLGELNFVCKEGWTGHDGNCYLEVGVPMTWDDARETCHRQGGHLLWINNEMEYDYISSGATVDMFWVGLQYTRSVDGNNNVNNDAEWPDLQDVHRSVDLRHISYWDINEPNQGDGSSSDPVCGMGQRNKGLALKKCTHRKPFFCKYEACLQDQTPCATGGGCYSAADTCDGRYDCEDKSDERDCRTADHCSYYYRLTQTSDNFDTARIEDGTRCSYVLEAPVGKRIQLTVPRTTLEKDIAFLEIWTGSPDLRDATQIASLTGLFQQDVFISMNNFMTVLLMVGDVSSTRSGITLSWTTEIAEISSEVIEATIDNNWRYITPPFSKEDTPLYLELTWKMVAPEGEVIMYYMESYVKSEGTMLIVLEGGMETSPARTMDPFDVNRQFFASAASTLLVYWNSGAAMSSFKLWFKTGCNIEIDEAVGALQVPNFREPSDSYPSELTCTWTLTGGQSRSRGLDVNFKLVELDGDPRTDTRLEQTSEDSIMIWKSDDPEISERVIASGKKHSPGGYMKIEFKSDLIINQGVGFTAEFSVDCPVLEDLVSGDTILSPARTATYESTVTVTCSLGYKFDAAEYYNMPSVNLVCKEKGIWTYNNKMDIRIPNCKVVHCGVPNEINNGYIQSVEGTSYGKTAIYECNDGFGKSHNNPVRCNEDGVWENRPSCTSATCQASDIQLTMNGRYEVEAGNEITPPLVDVNTVVLFVCNSGFELVGSQRSYCRKTGWSDLMPQCHRVRCPLPSIEHAQPIPSSTVLDFEDTITVTCMGGYGVTGNPAETSKIVTCGSDRMLTPEFECSDINECDNNPCDTTTTKCENNDGSYKCMCLEGFQAISYDPHRCEDIRQCDVDNGGCDVDNGMCVEETGGLPGYHCECNQGYILFTEAGPHHGHSIPASETGYRYGDVYYFDHTCIRVSCPYPTDTNHATLLSTELLFRYQDTLELVCEDGYHISGQAETVIRQTRNCLENGNWDNANFTCSARTCSTVGMNPSSFDYSYDRMTINFGEELILTCQWTNSTTITRRAICMYKDGSTVFGGDDITTCPQIDCGSPQDWMPNGGRTTDSPSTAHLDHQSFTFDCDPGFIREGSASEVTNDYQVQCKENGRWSFRTLRCSGQKCSDPGTPAEAMQVVTNYEAGQKLHYMCNRAGYQPVLNNYPYDQEYTCTYNSNTNTAEWVPSLDTLPVCTDVTNPEIQNLPTTTLYRDRMDMANFNAPYYTDNFGIKLITASDSFKSSDIVKEDITITYTAEDFDGNLDTKNVIIKVIDRNIQPILNCPSYLEVLVDSETPSSYDVRQDVTSNGTVTFSQEFVSVSVNNIGTHVRIDVTAANQHDTKAYCSFLVTFKANRCFDQTLYPDSNAVRNCNDLQTDGTITCTSTCRSNYLYGDGTKEKTFTCSGMNNWNMNYPNVFCLPSESPAYQFTAYVIHQFDYLSKLCKAAYLNAVSQNLNNFESQMSGLNECTNIVWDIISHDAGAAGGSTEFSANFTVKLISTNIADDARNSCIQAIKDNMAVFDFPSGNMFCSAAGYSPSINTASLTTTDGAFDCVTTSYRLIDSDIGKKCIPCGPGQFYSAGTCSFCPEGQYNGGVDGTCIQCNPGETPNTQKTDCIITCPDGFWSHSGLMPCTPCSTNSYGEDSQTCTPCDPETSTSGREGVMDATGCYAKCPNGTYSQSGYQDMDCKPCPRNFYQPNEGQTTCLPCNVDKVTDNMAETDSNSCKDYSFLSGEDCNGAYCSDHGTCDFRHHRPVCTCNPGYKGERCQESFHICDGVGSPCMNGATCVRGATYLDYTCECIVEKDNALCYEESFADKEGGNVNNPINELSASLSQCQTQCLNNDACKSLTHYTLSSGISFCLLYGSVIPENELINYAGRTHYNKNCPAVFGGDKCEQDLVDGCTTTSPTYHCSEESMCKNTAVVLNGYECLCPSLGGYTGTYCDQVAAPCSNVTCQNGGTCVNFGNVGFECSCRAGYTGKYCDEDINECDLNPNACLFGTCNNGVNGYTCSCGGGFDGHRCQISPNFCASNNCLGNVCYNSIDDRNGICHCQGPYFVASGDFACSATAVHPCNNINCSSQGTCTNLGNYQWRCDCQDGYTGSLCQHSVDDCTATSCVHGQCMDEHQGVRCECDDGYDGDHCENNIDNCAVQPCGNHGTCQDLIDGYVCRCEPGYTGSVCEIEINECLSQPCYNGGTCVDRVNGFTCQCVDGWVNTANCQEWNKLCTPELCNNNGQCFDLKGDKVCRCGGGTQGDYCEGLRSVCETISNADVCMNNGTCQDDLGSAQCRCPIVPDMDRCFSIVHQDKEGGNAGEIGSASPNINLEACKQRCLDNVSPPCESLSYFSIGSTTFCKIYSVRSPETMTDDPGALHFEKACPTDFTGKACEQVKDWCSVNNNPCQHNGQCVTKPDKGFECKCEEGYNGTTCEIAAEPCNNSPCPSGANCRSSVTQHYCQCPQGREIMAGNCRPGTFGTNLILLVANAAEDMNMGNRMKRDSHYDVPNELPRLKTAFRMSGSTLSVQLWVRVHSYPAGEPYNILRLVGSEHLFPLHDENPKLVLLITNSESQSEVQLTYKTETINLQFDPLERAKWYHIGVSLGSDKKLWYTIKAVEVPVPEELPVDTVDFSNLNAQLVFGDTNMVLEFNRVTVWETALENSNFANALVDKDYVANNATLTQGWYNVKLTIASKILTTELSADLFSVDKTPPAIICDGVAYEKMSAERIVRRSELQHLTAKINAVPAVTGGLVKHSIPDDLTWGYYPGIVLVEANGRQAMCRFPVYIKYNSRCPAPVDDGDVTITPCDSTDNDGVCDLQCNSGTARISAPTPRYKPCGALGVYDWKMPWKNPVLPTCAVGADQKYVVDVSMQYIFSIACILITDVETKIEAEIRNIFDSLNDFWYQICKGTDCTNLKFQMVMCNAAENKKIDLKFSLYFDSDKLTAQKESGMGGYIDDGTLKLDDALKSIIVLENKINLDRFASAVPDFTSVVVTMRTDCTTPGYNLINGVCVPCGKGLVYREESGQCEKCPMGTYKGGNDIECKPCGNGMTTVNEGETSMTKCVAECAVGRFYDTAQVSCQNCHRHYYQDKVGQSFCTPCKLGYKTQGEGSAHADDCKADCEAGYKRNATGSCVLCDRGFWRDQSEDDCQPCEGDTTTIPGEIAVNKEKCSMDVCAIGNYWSIEEGKCKACDHGKYQDKEAMLKCESCEGNKTTENMGESSADKCVFYCASGYEINPDVAEACLPCQRGFYKDNSEIGRKFEMCKSCGDKTTDDIAADKFDLCEYEICERGEYLVDKVCTSCDLDYYQPMFMPDSSVRCTKCPNIGDTPQGTEGMKSENVTDCKPICSGGQYFEESAGQCIECLQGSFKPDADRFGNCKMCPDSFTTDVTNSAKKMSEVDCYIPLCNAGNYVMEQTEVYVCAPCDVDKYQSKLHPDAGDICEACPKTEKGVNQGTKVGGANSSDLCEPVCPGGQEYMEATDECALCPVGKYKPDNDRFGMCSSCTEGFITDGKGKMSLDDCIIRDCDPGSYDNGTQCILCPYGFYQDKRTQTSCESCGTNLNTSKEGSKSKQDCQAFCGAGQQITNDPNICDFCPQGYYKPSPSYNPCDECPIDYTSNENRTDCNVLFCSPGKEHVQRSTGDECVECFPGKYKTTSGNTACLDCPLGLTNNEAGQTSCDILHCEPGKYEKDGQCELCDIGRYKEVAGNQECTICPYRKTTAGKGTVYQGSCSRVVCEAGQYRVGETECRACPLNEYQDLIGQTDCNMCGSGKVTMQTNSSSAADCVPECGQGQEYNSDIKDCDQCRQRYYKDNVGNFEACTECPSDKTTVGPGSTSVADCTQDDCNAGSYVKTDGNQVVCVECPKGQYQPERSQSKCLDCPAERETTENTGSTKLSQCVVQCQAGYELVYPIPASSPCRPCDLGWYNTAQGTKSNECKRCQEGYTTSTLGQSACTLPDPLPRPAPISVTLVFLFIYRVGTDCTELSLTIIQANIQRTIRGGLNSQRSRYPGICGINSSSCNSITVSLKACTAQSALGRRKRDITHELEVEVTMPNVPNTVADTVDDAVLETPNVVAKLFETNPEDFSPTLGTIEYGRLTTPATVTPVCGPGFEISEGTCRTCQPGTYWNSGSETCMNCGVNEYQDMTNSTSCKMCPALTFNDNEGATSADSCKSYCVENTDYCHGHGNCTETGRKTATCSCETDYTGDRCDALRFCRANPNYCNNHGTCLETGPSAGVCSCEDGYFGDQCQNLPYCTEHPDYCNNRGTCTEDSNNNPSCSCNSGFYGNTCESKETPDSDYNALIGGLVGGIVGLLVIILIIIGVVRCLMQRDKGERKHRYLQQTHQTEEPEYFRNPVYDNRSSAGSVPAVFTAMPAVDYYANPYAHYSYPSNKPKHHAHDQSETRPSPRQGEDEFIWQA